MKGHPRLEFPYHVARNTLFGGLASLLAASTYSGEDPLGILPARVLGASVIIGGAGIAIVNGLFSQAQKNETIENLRDALEELLQKKA